VHNIEESLVGHGGITPLVQVLLQRLQFDDGLAGMQGHVQRPEVGLILSSEARDFRSFVFQFDGFSARVWGQAHQLNQLYGICGCTPLVHDPGRQGPPGTADTDPPTIPGKPTGSSPSAGAISINWTASTDASPPITYRIHRDGNPTVIGFGTSTSFTDTGLIPGSQHTYTIDAVDGLNNPPSLLSPASDQITVATADTDPPTIPGKPTGSSPSAGAISINWTASTDASPPITYRIYRDGNPTVIGSGMSTSFTDTGLIPGSQHTYTIDAVDGVNNPPSLSSPASDQITVATPSVIFSDSFASGNFSNWTSVTRLTIDNGSGGVAPPSARAAVNAQIAFAYKNLPSTLSAICMSTKVNVSSLDPSATTLLRLRTAANGPIVRVFANPSGILYVRSDASSTQIWSGVALGTGWHSLKLCGTVGISGTWNLYRDAVKIVNGWTANTGTTPVGRVDIGNAQTFTATVNFDDVVIDPARELGATGRQDRLTKARPRPRARAVHPAPRAELLHVLISPTSSARTGSASS
jgi:chitodextrinase